MLRKLLTGSFVGVALFAAPAAKAQTPAIAHAWGRMSLSLEQCLTRGADTLKRMGFKRIEAIDRTVYGDFGRFQIGLHCLADEKLFYVFGGGPYNEDKRLIDQVAKVKTEFLQ